MGNRGDNMRIFRLTAEEGRLTQYKGYDFKVDGFESQLEALIEKNPHCLLQDEAIMMIGRQVVTNLGSVIDLVAVDKSGTLIVIELKRDRTPRETIAQALEYLSFAEDLSYEQLEGIFTNYLGEEATSLADYHRNYFKLKDDEPVAFNKKQKALIVAQRVTGEIKQTANYLRKKGLDFYCLEFKCFVGPDNETIIAVAEVVGNEPSFVKSVNSGSLPKVDRESFISALDDNGRTFFVPLLNFAEVNGLPIHWGSKGFSINVDLAGMHVGILYGYPPHAVYGQSVYTACAEILRKVRNGKRVIEVYQRKLGELGVFERAGREMKMVIDAPIPVDVREEFLKILFYIVDAISTQS